MISFPQLRHLCRRQGEGYCFHIAVTPASSDPLHDSTLPPNIHSLLAKYAPLFQDPQTLPPACATDHHIHLMPQAAPVNVRPYRYPHFQKHEIE